MIKGNIIGLRAVEKEDLVLLKNWRNIPEFRKCFREVRELNMNNQELWFEKSCNNNPNNFMFIIQDINKKEPIGACGLLYVNWIIRSADFSFYIGKDNLYIDDKGFAKEAAQLLIEYGFNSLNLNKLWMELYEFDVKKIKFFTEYFNFSKDGFLRDNCFEDGKYWNSFIISLLRKDTIKKQ